MPTIEKTTIEGQVKSISIYKKVSPEQFIRLFLDDLSGLLKIENMAEYKVMVHLWKMASFKDNGMGNKLVLVKAIKEDIAKEIGYSLQSVSNAIGSLVKKRLLINEGRSIYYLNPSYFFKGSESDRKDAIEAYEVHITYEIESSMKANGEAVDSLFNPIEEAA